MGYDESDLWVESGLDALYEELGPVWADAHAKERLISYFVAHPDLAHPAYESLKYARSLSFTHPRAAIVFAASTIELTVKSVLLRPIVFGLVHNESVAEFIADLTTRHSRGIDTFRKLLTQILAQFGQLDLEAFTRTGSSECLIEEVKRIENARNAIVHRGDTTLDALAPLAIDVAICLLIQTFPKVIEQLNLHLHDDFSICNKPDLPLYGHDSSPYGV